jgi:ParB family transcriptional regulator, chromosome partitioning protein
MIDKKTRKKEIGKGIRALLSTAETAPDPDVRAEAQRVLSSEVTEIPLDVIEPNPFQPRQDWDTEALEELSASIRALGIIQPVTLRATGPDKYQLISGERRFRAARLAGLTGIPAYIRTAGDQEMLEMALVENIQRSDLNAIEVAISYQRLLEECDLTHESLSGRVGKERSTISNYTRLLKLAPDIQDAIRQGRISMGHARALAGVGDLLRQRQAFRDTLEKGWSVRQLEQYLRGQDTPRKSGDQNRDKNRLAPALRDIESQLASHLGARVTLEHKNTGTGKIVIPYSDEEDLHRILEMLHL